VDVAQRGGTGEPNAGQDEVRGGRTGRGVEHRRQVIGPGVRTAIAHPVRAARVRGFVRASSACAA
jgi:hypothetical protein